MNSRTKVVIAGVAAVGALGAGTTTAIAAGGDDDGTPAITGSALDSASAAALEATGGGRVTGTEAGDEEGAYEVEVTRDDGSQVDVHLDEGFNVIGSEGDDDYAEDE